MTQSDHARVEAGDVRNKRERPRREVSTAEATYWDIDDLQFHCRIGRTTAWRLVRTDGFPPPVVLGPKNLVWPRRAVLAYMESCTHEDHYASRPISSSKLAQAVSYRSRPVANRERHG
jgi:predicted DNA-binding transcriptional regulator AlpA